MCTLMPRLSWSWAATASARPPGSPSPGTGPSGTWSGMAALRSKPASSSAAVPAGPLKSYHGVPTQPPATTHGARKSAVLAPEPAAVVPEAAASPASALRSTPCPNAWRTDVLPSWKPVPKPRYAVARPGRGRISSSGRVEIMSRSAAPGSSIPSTSAPWSAEVRADGSAAQRRTITDGGPAAGRAEPFGDAPEPAGDGESVAEGRDAGAPDGPAPPDAPAPPDGPGPPGAALPVTRTSWTLSPGDQASTRKAPAPPTSRIVDGSASMRSTTTVSSTPSEGWASRAWNAPSGAHSVNRTVRGPVASIRPMRPAYPATPHALPAWGHAAGANARSVGAGVAVGAWDGEADGLGVGGRS